MKPLYFSRFLSSHTFLAGMKEFYFTQKWWSVQRRSVPIWPCGLHGPHTLKAMEATETQCTTGTYVSGYSVDWEKQQRLGNVQPFGVFGCIIFRKWVIFCQLTKEKEKCYPVLCFWAKCDQFELNWPTSSSYWQLKVSNFAITQARTC